MYQLLEQLVVVVKLLQVVLVVMLPYLVLQLVADITLWAGVLQVVLQQELQ